MPKPDVPSDDASELLAYHLSLIQQTARGEIQQLNTLDPAERKDRAKTAEKAAAELFGDEKRKEETRQVFHRAFIWFLRVAAFMFLLMLVARVLHFILPEDWLWLSDEQVQDMDGFLFSGTLGGLIVKFLSPMIRKESEP